MKFFSNTTTNKRIFTMGSFSPGSVSTRKTSGSRRGKPKERKGRQQQDEETAADPQQQQQQDQPSPPPRFFFIDDREDGQGVVVEDWVSWKHKNDNNADRSVQERLARNGEAYDEMCWNRKFAHPEEEDAVGVSVTTDNKHHPVLLSKRHTTATYTPFRTTAPSSAFWLNDFGFWDSILADDWCVSLCAGGWAVQDNDNEDDDDDDVPPPLGASYSSMSQDTTATTTTTEEIFRRETDSNDNNNMRYISSLAGYYDNDDSDEEEATFIPLKTAAAEEDNALRQLKPASPLPDESFGRC